ncbi:ubiquinone biosynthesis protein COQ4 [Cupriavidus basilensis]|uniref:ubiquinone biosynthesis protein COQ4 n=1 Tax=Cupriavidus basilensis TaxID=68895 RepID=UPI0020A66862|nr:ubiquinone biosynthesis protein COQ4 [Cupriavidus basilensis]MCP3022153.1 ubiquinone biosynthesis protein COQ4 [Cupriavidus basilensis]
MDVATSPALYKRDLPAAFRAIRKLLANGDDTTQVFLIMRALNGPSAPKNYARLLRTTSGRRLAYLRVELTERFSDPAFIASFAPGTLGAAYREFLEQTGYSAAGLAAISNLNSEPLVEDPYAWFGRRTRDIHDIWHVLTGYKANENMGEAALVAFSYAQTGALGWAFIAVATALQSLRKTGNTAYLRAVVEGYRHGRKAKWLMAEDYETLLHEPLEAARARLGILEPVLYQAASKAAQCQPQGAASQSLSSD